MRILFNTHPGIAVEANQIQNFKTATIGRIAAFNGSLSVHPEAFKKHPHTFFLRKQDFNASVLRAATIEIPKIVEKTNLEAKDVNTGVRSMRQNLRIAPGSRLLAPTFFEHTFLRVAQSTAKLGLDAMQVLLVQEYIEGKTYQQLADDRDRKKKDVTAQFTELQDAARVCRTSELALYLMMSGELYDYTDDSTLPPNTTPTTPDQLLCDITSLEPVAPPIQAPPTYINVLNQMNQPE